MTMKITILGSGGALPPKGRAQTGIFIEKGERCLLLDCGSGMLMRLDQANIDVARLNSVLLTHHHLDHMSDLLPLLVARWLRDKTHTSIYGPEGMRELIDELLKLYEYVRRSVKVEVTELKSGDRFELEGFQIEALQTDHGGVPMLAYKFDGKFVFSGDTTPFSGMAEFARGCRLLIHECSFPDGFEVPNHATPRRLGEVLASCAVERLVLTHLYPQTQGHEEEMINSIRKHFNGKVELAEDFMSFEL
jgi:ribonuclease BN (tRNA processing enzyme)